MTATTSTSRPLRADAARNRARLLEVAYETFAAEGLAVPIDEIARRAGVGAGTVYRHFPTKEALFEAVIEDRVRGVVARARELMAADPGTALFEFMQELACAATADQGLLDAFEGYGVDVESAGRDAEGAFLGIVEELITAAQRAGTVRRDVGLAELKALMMVCKSAREYGPGVADRVAAVITDGLRTSR